MVGKVAAGIEQAKVVVLSDGRAGHENQSLGVATALGHPAPEVISLRPHYPQAWLRWLPVQLLFGPKLATIPACDMLIGTGWQVSRVMRHLRRAGMGGGQSFGQNLGHKGGRVPFTVQLMRPSGLPRDYDVVALPRHDAAGAWAADAGNVLVTTGAPNRISAELLAQERDRWSGRLRHCLASKGAPKLAVLVGGSSKHGVFDEMAARRLMESVLAWAHNTGGSLLVTTSRRSGPAVTALVKQMLQGQQTVPYHFWQPDEPAQRDNPYLAYLASCDGVVVTAESVAMVSEAATAGKPVFIYGEPASMPKKFQVFYESLRKQQRLAPWQGKLNLRVPKEGLADAALVAGFVLARWEARRQSREAALIAEA